MERSTYGLDEYVSFRAIIRTRPGQGLLPPGPSSSLDAYIRINACLAPFELRLTGGYTVKETEGRKLRLDLVTSSCRYMIMFKILLTGDE